MQKGLTPQKKKILDFINFYSEHRGFSPSLEEIKNRLKLKSVSTIHQHVDELEKAGYLKKEKNQKRSIGIKNLGSTVKIPLLGTIAAGGPIEAIRNPEQLEVPRDMLSKDANHYALRVSGTSMIDENIFDGDIVIVKHQLVVENGEKAVAYLPDKDTVTLKKIYRDGNRVKLVPANKTMEPFYEKNVQIQGKVVGIIKK